MDESKPVKDNVVDLRRHPRFRMAPPVVLSLARIEISFLLQGHRRGEGTVADLSAKGCKVMSQTQVRVGDRLSLTIHVPKHDAPFRVGVALVRWITRGSFGLEWTALYPDDEQRLQMWMRTES
jgi:PilZ domain-containing protein